ncbi:ORF67A [Felid gammaherpesvirus 1]|uniref:ORF67A n=1 Tax=Felid gammaherpesvirus 1 TaxID=2560468 RepID=A0A0M4MS71_9GAMA|nr:ORF67A [Felis catus gammaherpesvirus 1]ALE14783.1 ORF67A [Felis catus gammaherpesvirus 1]
MSQYLNSPHLYENLICFESLLPEDIKIFVPTVYTKLNLLNYCQYLKVFLVYNHLAGSIHKCSHQNIIFTKLEIIKQVISRIIETDSVYSNIN